MTLLNRNKSSQRNWRVVVISSFVRRRYRRVDGVEAASTASRLTASRAGARRALWPPRSLVRRAASGQWQGCRLSCDLARRVRYGYCRRQRRSRRVESFSTSRAIKRRALNAACWPNQKAGAALLWQRVWHHLRARERLARSRLAIELHDAAITAEVDRLGTSQRLQ